MRHALLLLFLSIIVILCYSWTKMTRNDIITESHKISDCFFLWSVITISIHPHFNDCFQDFHKLHLELQNYWFYSLKYGRHAEFSVQKWRWSSYCQKLMSTDPQEGICVDASCWPVDVSSKQLQEDEEEGAFGRDVFFTLLTAIDFIQNMKSYGKRRGKMIRSPFGEERWDGREY